MRRAGGAAAAAIAVAVALYSGAEARPALTVTPAPGDIGHYVSGVMAGERIPGVAVVVVQEDRIVYSRGFGTASLEEPTPVTPQTVFDLGSCSKSFTAMAVLLLHSEGLIEMDRPATDYLPNFRLADRDTSKQITIRHLPTHTSGLPGRIAEPLAFHSGADAMDKLVSSMARVRLNRPAGDSFEYSDLNYALLGAVIERVAGVPFEEYMQDRVFGPLGLASTTLYQKEAAAMPRADGHQLSFGRVITRNTPIYRSAKPAGWVMSSVNDLGRWLALHLNGGRLGNRQLLPESLVQMTHRAAVTFAQNGTQVGYGMGWFTATLADQEPAVWHSGDTANFATDMILLPRRGVGVAVLVNSQNSSRVHDIAPGIMSLLLGRPFHLPEPPLVASWETADVMATGAAALSVVMLLFLPVYVWNRWRRLSAGAAGPGLRAATSRTFRFWRLVLPLTPLGLVAAVLTATVAVFWVLLGINVFRTVVRLGAFTPPGVWISAWLLLATVSSWALVLAVGGLITKGRARYSAPRAGRT